MKNLRGASLMAVAAAAQMMVAVPVLDQSPVRRVHASGFKAVPGARTLIRRRRSRTPDGEHSLFARLQDGAAERIAKAEAKRQRKAERNRRVAG